MSSHEDREWNNGPVYRPTFRIPTFVKEVGLAQNELRPSTLPDKETLDRGERVKNIYQSLAATWKNGNSSDAEIQFVKCVRPRPLPVIGTSSSTLPSRVATSVTGDTISASVNSTKSTTSIATRNRSSAQTPVSQWFIRHALATTTPTNQFSLTAPPSSAGAPSQRASLASLIDLPDPGNGPAFVPPPHFHIKPGNKGYDMLKTLGWSGRGLGKIEASAESTPAGATDSEKRRSVVKQDPSDCSTKKRMRKSTSQSFSDFASSSSDESSFDTPPSPPRLSSTSYNARSSGATFPSSRRTLIAPISTTLKSDLLGIRPSSSTGGHHRAITHTARSIKLANRDSALAEGRMGPKATRRKVERERKERLELMARLNR
ncbi:G-patch domain [Phaffia rhodozyma]|uniref:G-patch domain n=1 Tax=Phaffia rhodozyma TaxID=264483 RepID=A0A0F7SF47_PHARH|nr:G-patch domain [Phaffia rhodozyma]